MGLVGLGNEEHTATVPGLPLAHTTADPLSALLHRYVMEAALPPSCCATAVM